MLNCVVNPGRTCASDAPSRLNSLTQNEWNVDTTGRFRCVGSPSNCRTRSRISPDALLVKVTARMHAPGTWRSRTR